jgi:putative hydrolase of HD superfamily
MGRIRGTAHARSSICKRSVSFGFVDQRPTFPVDLDRFEMACQGKSGISRLFFNQFRTASEYERRHAQNLQGFFDSSIPFLRHEEVRDWGESLLKERESRLQSEGQANDLET